MNISLESCTLCPHNCKADRLHGQTGFCGQTAEMKLARAALHYWEEPCISGTCGAGAVFFCGCNLRCIYCQNSDLSHSRLGKSVSCQRLAEIMLDLQDQGAADIDLVTPGHFIPQIAESITLSRKAGLKIPIVYNTGSYEYADSLRLLAGLVDIYMPDLKYMDSELSGCLSNAPDYFDKASLAIEEMYRQTGPAVFDTSTGLMKKGILLRHLVLPGHTKDSIKLLDYVYDRYGDNIYISIMNQYTPIVSASESLSSTGFPELTRALTEREYDKVIDHCINLGISNAFIQEGPTCKESFIPVWDYTGL